MDLKRKYTGSALFSQRQIQLLSVGVAWTHSNLSLNSSNVGACEWHTAFVTERHASKDDRAQSERQHALANMAHTKQQHQKQNINSSNNNNNKLHTVAHQYSTQPSLILTLNRITTVQLAGGALHTKT